MPVHKRLNIFKCRIKINSYIHSYFNLCIEIKILKSKVKETLLELAKINFLLLGRHG